MIRLLISVLTLSLVSPAFAQVREPGLLLQRTDLTNWTLQSSAQVSQGGAALSMPTFDASTWFAAQVPTTVVAALVDDQVYPDPYYDANLRYIPGTTYPFGDNFAVDPMPVDSPFAVSWWYRTQMTVRRLRAGTRVWLNFDSINYRANIWLNGQLLADSSQVAGMYRAFEFDITDLVVPGANVLAVEIFPPGQHDLSLSFVDWNPLPADKDMGIVQSAYLLYSGPVSLRNPQVISQLNATFDQAQLTLYADLTNGSSQAIQGTLCGSVGDISFSKAVQLGAGVSTKIAITPQDAPQLSIASPQLWWPAGLGPQNLYQLQIRFEIRGAVSDRAAVQFGIRQIGSEVDSQQHRVFSINGKQILIRGAAWTHEMMLRQDPQREEYEVRYARDMHLNALRLEGKMFDDNLYDLADRYGVLIMPGWCCCSGWEEWDQWTPDEYTVAGESMRNQLRQLRNHPSVFVFLYGSDNAPPPAAEQIYLQMMAEENWPNPYLNAASNQTTPGAGPSGVKMTGPYDWVRRITG